MDFRGIREFLRDFMGYIITFLIIVFVFTFIVSIQPIAGNSMSPTLSDGNITIVSKLTYKLSKIKRNDVVVIKTKDDERYVKRIIGLPGENVSHLNGLLFINNDAYSESFLDEDVITSNFLLVDICPMSLCPNGVIPEDYYLVLGDNREDSFDSRDPDMGLVSIKEIQGKVVFNLWPLDKIGKIY